MRDPATFMLDSVNTRLVERRWEYVTDEMGVEGPEASYLASEKLDHAYG